MHSTTVIKVRLTAAPRCLLSSSQPIKTLRDPRTLNTTPVSSILYTFSARDCRLAKLRRDDLEPLHYFIMDIMTVSLPIYRFQPPGFYFGMTAVESLRPILPRRCQCTSLIWWTLR